MPDSRRSAPPRARGAHRGAKSNVGNRLSVRYSREVVDFFRATGDGWQSRMDGALKEYVAQHSRR